MSKQVSIKRMPVESLNPQPAYQRPLDEARVLRMVENFDYRKIGVPEVTEAGNVIDAQHRIAAMKLLGLRFVECRVHIGLGYEEEVALYRALNNERKALRPLDDFKAALEEKDPDALALDEIVRAGGFRFGTTSTPNYVAAIRTFQRMYRNGPETLREVLVYTAPMKDTADEQISGEVFEGLHVFLSAWGGAIDTKRLAMIMQKHTARWWRAAAETNTNSERRAYRMAALIGHEYNKRLSKTKQLVKDVY